MTRDESILWTLTVHSNQLTAQRHFRRLHKVCRSSIYAIRPRLILSATAGTLSKPLFPPLELPIYHIRPEQHSHRRLTVVAHLQHPHVLHPFSPFYRKIDIYNESHLERFFRFILLSLSFSTTRTILSLRQIEANTRRTRDELSLQLLNSQFSMFIRISLL